MDAVPFFVILLLFRFGSVRSGINDIINVIRMGNSYKVVVQCDIYKFRESQVTTKPYLWALGLERKLANSKDYRVIAVYQPTMSPAHRQMVVVPAGRQWEYQFTGGQGWRNKYTIKLVLYILNADHTDSGLYRCYYRAPSTTDATFSDPYNLTIGSKDPNQITVTKIAE
ncbi:hypothetical protein Btru_042471 [Bulinus truncatus]|nr:hypothetical protein Btru_042471 [Bulinus truncatus]